MGNLFHIGEANMKIDFSTPICDFDGKPLPLIKEGKVVEDKTVTLATVCVEALNATFPDERELDGKEKFDRFMLASKVYSGGEIDLKVEDLAMIKKLVGKAYGPLVVGRVYELIDEAKKPRSVKKAEA